jgi:hypothetical protein
MMSPKWESKVPVPVHYLSSSGGPLNLKTFVGQDMASFFSGRLLARTKNSKLRVDGSVIVDIQRECFEKISEFLKRNWPRAARFGFTMGFIMAKISKNLKSSFLAPGLQNISNWLGTDKKCLPCAVSRIKNKNKKN